MYRLFSIVSIRLLILDVNNLFEKYVTFFDISVTIFNRKKIFSGVIDEGGISLINVQVQCCGMLLLWLTTYFYCKSRRMNLRTQRIYCALLLISNLCVIADIFSVFAIYYSDRLPAFVVMLSCKVYLILLIALAYSGLMYICSDTYFNDRTFHKFQFFYSSIFFVSAVLILVLPISYLCESDGAVIYSDGAAAIAAYLSAVIAMVGILVHIYLGRKILYPRRRKAVILWLAIWLLSAILQYLNHSLLVVTFAGIMGVVIIFSMIENPDSSLDRSSGLFNVNAMKQYLQYAYGNQQHFSHLSYIFGFFEKSASFLSSMLSLPLGKSSPICP